jgi:hypothetical protein
MDVSSEDWDEASDHTEATEVDAEEAIAELYTAWWAKETKPGETSTSCFILILGL